MVPMAQQKSTFKIKRIPRKANLRKKNGQQILSAVFLAIVVVGCYAWMRHLKFAETRQSMAMPMYLTTALLLEASARTDVEDIISARTALPSSDKIEFSDSPFEVAHRQIQEAGALERLLNRRGRTVGYLQSIQKDLEDQIEIGVLSENERSDLIKVFKELARLGGLHSACVKDANNFRTTLENGLTQADGALAARIATVNNIAERIKNTDLVSRCADQSALPVQMTEQLTAIHDEHVGAFNAAAIGQQSARNLLTSCSAIALFFMGRAAKHGFALAWSRFNKRIKVPGTRR